MKIRTYKWESFGTIRNNTALKQIAPFCIIHSRFGTIRNNTALKQEIKAKALRACFGTIRNNTALKLTSLISIVTGVLEPFETTQL